MGHLFRNDYSELGHEKILQALLNAKDEQNIGYGLDQHSLNASKLIKEIFDCKEAEVHFLAGGTQANMVVLSFLLKDYEGVICAKTGHINVHETAAVEGSGHKIVTIEGKNGKVTIPEIEKELAKNNSEHCVKIKAVYISNSTESGTIYSKNELVNLSKFCKEHDLYLFLDGARLGAALTSKENDIDRKDIAKYVDAFYIGGTKNGLLMGEAIVLVNPALHNYFRYELKNKGAMLAKGFFEGIEFETIFQDDLYFEIAHHANQMASLLANGLRKRGLDVAPSPTNQQFVTLDKIHAGLLMDEFGCEEWTDLGESMVIRFVCSFATKEEHVKEVFDFIDKNF